MRELKFSATTTHHGKRLDHALAQEAVSLGWELTRSQIKNLIEQKHVRVDGVWAIKAGQVLQTGQSVEVQIPEPKKLDLTPREVGIRILYEDEALAVLDKPAGLSVHPSTTEDSPTVVHGLLHSLKTLSSVGGVERPGIVHRIDKGTSGVLVVSKTDAAHLALSRQFKAHTIDRRYRALVYGKMPKDAGTMETFFGRHPTHRKKMTGKLTQGRRAITHWRVEEQFDGLCLVECRLETGRTHQIRVHLTELGHPLVGDPLYGDHERRSKELARRHKALGEACAEMKHQLLHAFHLGFEHPLSGKRMDFDTPLPEDFARVLQLARSSA